MINLRAVSGKTEPTYAVSVDPEILIRRYPSTLPAATILITNYPTRVVRGHEAEFADAHHDRRVLVGDPKWPAHASGPLAVWAMARLGYESIYIVGLDGTAIADPGSPEIAERASVWESWTSRYKKARGSEENSRTRLVRIWTGPPPESEPLGAAVVETLVVGPPPRVAR